MEKILSLIGPGDMEFHYYQLLKISPKKFLSELEKMAKEIADSGWTIELLPDKGITLEIAKLYKKFGGKKVIGTAPISDKRYGVNHIKENFDLKINGEKLFNEIIDTKDWRDQNRLKALHGHATLYLGISSGAEVEFNYGIYLYKLIKGLKKKVNAKAVSGINAGEDFTYLIYSPFILNKKLDRETEEYMKKYGIKLEYVKNPKELRKTLENLTPS